MVHKKKRKYKVWFREYKDVTKIVNANSKKEVRKRFSGYKIHRVRKVD